MADRENSLETTVELSAEDYPEVMRIMESGGDVDAYLEDVGIPEDVFEDVPCAREKAAFDGSLLYVVGAAGGADGSLQAETIVLPVTATASLIGSLTAVTEEALRLAECLEGHPEAAATLRERLELLSLDIDRVKRKVDELSAHGAAG